MIKLYPLIIEYDIIDEDESWHARDRFSDRFGKNSLTPPELQELRRRYAKLNSESKNYDKAAVLLMALNRQIIFSIGEVDKMRDSNGDVIWAVVRFGSITTIFGRRSTQNFEYWADPARGNVRKDHIYYMNTSLKIKSLPHSTREKTSSAIQRLTDFRSE